MLKLLTETTEKISLLQLQEIFFPDHENVEIGTKTKSKTVTLMLGHL